MCSGIKSAGWDFTFESLEQGLEQAHGCTVPGFRVPGTEAEYRLGGGGGAAVQLTENRQGEVGAAGLWKKAFWRRCSHLDSSWSSACTSSRFLLPSLLQ